MRCSRTPVAVPAAVRPLARHERVGQDLQPLVLETESAQHVERQPVLRGATAYPAFERRERAQSSRLREPGDDAVRRGIDRVVARNPELDERGKPPERAAPLAVRMNAVVLRKAGYELVTHEPRRQRRGPVVPTALECRRRTPHRATDRPREEG